MSKATVKDKGSHFSATRERAQFFVILFVAGLSSYEFILKDIIRPAQEPTAFDLVATLENVGKKNENILVRASITARNPTDRRIYVPAFWFTVRGYWLFDSTEPVLTNHKSILEMGPGDELISTYAPIESSEIVAQKRICYTGDTWCEPDEKINDEVIFALPEGKFDFLEMQVFYMQTRDNSALDDPIWDAREDGSWYAQFNLKEGGSDSSKIIEWQISTSAGYCYYITTLPFYDSK